LLRKRSAISGVGTAPMAASAVGVGNDPDAVPPVRGTNGRSWNNVPLRVIPERGQRPENLTHPSIKQR
jgi:hypothetical protein